MASGSRSLPGQLKKVSVAGGAAINLCDAESGRGGTWTDDDTIIFSPSGTGSSTLLRVPAAGGKPTAFGTLGQGALTQRWPQALPGGTAVLYTEHSALTGFDAANIVVAPVSARRVGEGRPGEGRRPQRVLRALCAQRPWLAKRGEREGGHLLYIQQGTLFAVPFDPVRLETVGTGVPVIEGLSSSVVSGGAQVDVSREGTLVYVPGGVTNNIGNTIDWITRDGKTSALRAIQSEWANPRFSPGRPEDRPEHQRRQTERHLGVRLGPGHADPTDVRPR